MSRLTKNLSSDRGRWVVLFREVGGYAFRELAEALGISVSRACAIYYREVRIRHIKEQHGEPYSGEEPEGQYAVRSTVPYGCSACISRMGTVVSQQSLTNRFEQFGHL